tara:strand:- start:295 stop:489 length:195 start_codon:yes stop_codon:yes gene_type:complete
METFTVDMFGLTLPGTLAVFQRKNPLGTGRLIWPTENPARKLLNCAQDPYSLAMIVPQVRSTGG